MKRPNYSFSLKVSTAITEWRLDDSEKNRNKIKKSFLSNDEIKGATNNVDVPLETKLLIGRAQEEYLEFLDHDCPYFLKATVRVLRDHLKEPKADVAKLVNVSKILSHNDKKVLTRLYSDAFKSYR